MNDTLLAIIILVGVTLLIWLSCWLPEHWHLFRMNAESPYLQTILKGLYKVPAFAGDLEACQQQGEAAADQAYPRDANPYPVGTADHEWWDAGWSDSGNELCGT